MKSTPTSITPFLFGESAIRTSQIDGNPWFVIADVCKTLGISNSWNVPKRLHPDDLHSMEVIDSMGRTQTVNICNESGLYNLIFQSRKPAAEEFTRWVTSEVLPAIRRNGAYGSRSAETVAFVREMLGLGMSPRDTASLVKHTFAPQTRREALAEERRKQDAIDADSPADRDEQDMVSLIAHLHAHHKAMHCIRFHEIVDHCASYGLFTHLMNGEENADGHFILAPSSRRQFAQLLATTYADRIFLLPDGTRAAWSTKGENRGRRYLITLSARNTTARA
jgi:prophage antirepressor-like protein